MGTLDSILIGSDCGAKYTTIVELSKIGGLVSRSPPVPDSISTCWENIFIIFEVFVFLNEFAKIALPCLGDSIVKPSELVYLDRTLKAIFSLWVWKIFFTFLESTAAEKIAGSHLPFRRKQ